MSKQEADINLDLFKNLIMFIVDPKGIFTVKLVTKGNRKPKKVGSHINQPQLIKVGIKVEPEVLHVPTINVICPAKEVPEEGEDKKLILKLN